MRLKRSISTVDDRTKAPVPFLISVAILSISFYCFKKLESSERNLYGGESKDGWGPGFILLTMSGLTLLTLYLTFMFTFE